MKTHTKRICAFLLSVFFSLLQISVVSAEESTPAEEPISISVSIRENGDTHYLVQPLTLTCPGGTTAAGLLPLLQRYAYLTSYQLSEGTLLAVTIEENGSLSLIGGDGSWILRINGSETEEDNLPILENGDRVEWIYHPNDAGIDSDGDVPAPDVADAAIAALWNDECAAALSGACSWLKENGTGTLRLLALGAAGVSVDYRDIDGLLRTVSASGSYPDAASVAADILAVTFCGIHAENASGADLLAVLSNYPDISRGGVYSASLALLAADSNGYSLPSDGINTRATLRTAILSAQNSDGGFSLNAGEESSAFLTACAITALSRYSSYDEVRDSIQEGLSYLSSVQRSDGGFDSDIRYSSARTTGAVVAALCAVGVSPDSADFTKRSGNPLTALLSCRKDDGGFSARESAALSDEISTQQAVMALVSVKGSRSGYVLRTAIQSNGAHSSEPSSEPSSNTSSESGEDDPPDPAKRNNILFGSVGLLVGIGLGVLLLFVILLASRRWKHRHPDS